MLSSFKNHNLILVSASVIFIMTLAFAADYFAPGLITALPHNDLVYETGGYYTYRDNEAKEPHFGLNLVVKNNHIQVFYRGNCYYTVPKVYIFSAKTRQSREVSITPFNNYNDLLPSTDPVCQNAPNNRDDAKKITVINVPELEPLKLSNEITAPDGYVFLNQADDQTEYSFMHALFFGSFKRNPYLAWIKKGIYKIPLPYTGVEYDYYSKAEFVGWVVQ